MRYRNLQQALAAIPDVAIDNCIMLDGRTSYLVQFDRKGETVPDWFFADDLADVGFDD